ncbi:MAG: 4Fe-4S dicluster domain-containing protein [Chloroflexi bacterium]|nr:4Fe-4S dicluster domain-containing protein [Chloroflexota bacterium]
MISGKGADSDNTGVPVLGGREAEPRRVHIGHMIVNSSVCSGCRACEVICSFAHEGVFNPALSRVQISKDEPAGKDEPLVCRQCGNARCVQICPKKALSRHPINKAVVVDVSSCDGCGLCAEACPFGVVRMHSETRVPLLCDLCGGEPRCVPRCVTGALWYGEARGRPPRKGIGPQRREPANV